MILSFFTKRKNQDTIRPLYGAIMARALNPVLFSEFGTPDTFEGRFEAVTLHSALVLRRLKALPPPADATAQQLVDRIFDGIDSAMREVGIGDMGVPKRMKSFAKAFYGRLGAYTEALAQNDPREALAAALSRNVLEGKPAAQDFVNYVIEFARGLEERDAAALLRGDLPAPHPGCGENAP